MGIRSGKRLLYAVIEMPGRATKYLQFNSSPPDAWDLRLLYPGAKARAMTPEEEQAFRDRRERAQRADRISEAW